MALRNLAKFSLVIGLVVVGCDNGVFPGGSSDPTVAAVVAKANTVAESVGGPGGFGANLMSGFANHMPHDIGFSSVSDLAPEGSTMTVNIRNSADRDSTFHLSYFAAHMDFEDHLMDIDVAAGEEVAVEIPCAEIVGMGPLRSPGEPGCHLSDGEAVDNIMAVPGFLGQDFLCDGTYECVLTRDVDDLDGDGDTEELIIVSGVMEFHMMNGGPTGHGHGTGSGMMGSHMGR